MNTKFYLDDRVRMYLKRAIKKSKSIRRRSFVTSDYLLLAVLEDNRTRLSTEMLDLGYEAEEIEEDLKRNSFYNKELLKNFYEEKENEEMYSREVQDILIFAQELASKKGLEKADEKALVVALVQNDNPIWTEMDEMDYTSLDTLRRIFSVKAYLEEADEKPKEKQTKKSKTLTADPSMFELLNEKFKKGDPEVILGRDKEIEQMWIIMQRMKMRNVLLVGRPGVGKTAIVEGITERIVNGNCPNEFKNRRVMSLQLDSLLEDTEFLGQREKKFKELKEFLEKNQDVILFIDEIHNIIGAGKTEGGSYDLANTLKPVLSNGKLTVIGATTQQEYEKYFKTDGALKRRFEVVEVEEPKTGDLYQMLKGKIHQLENYHGVHVSDKVFKTVVSEASSYDANTANPSRTVDLLDTAMVIAKTHNKKDLDSQSVLEVHKANLEKLRKMDKAEIMSTAYHEAGHYILERILNDKWNRVTLVTIIPTKDYLGKNVLEEKEEYFSKPKKDYINDIAMYLAGDIARSLKGYEKDSGKVGDLEVATEIAREMVLKYGMGKEDKDSVLGCHNSFPDYSCLSDSQKEELAKQTNEILTEAYELAEKTLKDNESKLDAIAKELFEKGSLNEDELDTLFLGKKKNITNQEESLNN